jgi:hypothetical protein
MATYCETPNDDGDDWYDPDTDALIEGGFFTRERAEWRVCVGCGDHYESDRALGVICERCDFLNSCDPRDDE